MFQYHFVYHKSDMNWTGNEPRLPHWQTGNQLPETWHNQAVYYMASPVWTESPWIIQLVNQLVYLWSGYIWFAFRAVPLTCKGFWFMQYCTLWWQAEFLVHCHGGWWWFGISPVRILLTTVFSHLFVRTGTQTLDTVCWDKVLWNLLCVFMCELNTVNW